MKAQKFFGGTKPKETGVKVRQVGTTGSVKNFTGHIAPKVTVKQAFHKGTKGGINIARKTTVKQVGTTGSR